MGIDPTSIMTGAATGVATNHLQQAVHTTFGKEPDPVVHLLTEILDAVKPKQKDTRNESFQLQPYPSEYIIPDDFNGHTHVCVFFFGTGLAVRFDGVYGGSYAKTNIGPGWYQLDVPGRLSLSSGTATPVVVSYRDEEIGVAF